MPCDISILDKMADIRQRCFHMRQSYGCLYAKNTLEYKLEVKNWCWDYNIPGEIGTETDSLPVPSRLVNITQALSSCRSITRLRISSSAGTFIRRTLILHIGHSGSGLQSKVGQYNAMIPLSISPCHCSFFVEILLVKWPCRTDDQWIVLNIS